MECAGGNEGGLTPANLLFDVLDELGEFGFGFDVFVPGEAHFGQVVLVPGADGDARHEGPGRVVLVAAGAGFSWLLWRRGLQLKPGAGRAGCSRW